MVDTAASWHRREAGPWHRPACLASAAEPFRPHSPPAATVTAKTARPPPCSPAEAEPRGCPSRQAAASSRAASPASCRPVPASSASRLAARPTFPASSGLCPSAGTSLPGGGVPSPGPGPTPGRRMVSSGSVVPSCAGTTGGRLFFGFGPGRFRLRRQHRGFRQRQRHAGRQGTVSLRFPPPPERRFPAFARTATPATACQSSRSSSR